MAQLKFVLDEEQKPTKEAVGMYSKDGEYVDFDKPCICEGQVCTIEKCIFCWLTPYVKVEVWLNRLLETMQSTIRHEMTEAVISYEEKPRDQWLFEPPAQVSMKLEVFSNPLILYVLQVALSGTQIWWTTEVNIAFARLEEGYENALKDYFKKQVKIMIALILIVNYGYRCHN